MAGDEHLPIERMETFRRFEDVSDRVWKAVRKWDAFARDTLGKQLVRAADSVGANLVEGDGRFGTGDSLQFFVIARASARETRYWIRRAVRRDLISTEIGCELASELIAATRMPNALITYRRDKGGSQKIREYRAAYLASREDPLIADWPNTEHLTPNT